MSITIANTTFDRVDYDSDGDVLYLHHGDPFGAIDFDASPEDHALRFDADGQLVGITILNARWLLEHEGEITLTVSPPEMHRLAPGQLQDVLAAA